MRKHTGARSQKISSPAGDDEKLWTVSEQGNGMKRRYFESNRLAVFWEVEKPEIRKTR